MASLGDRRNANTALFERRVRTDVAAGVLPADTDATALARFVGAVLRGMSLQARDGAGRVEPEAVVETALRGLAGGSCRRRPEGP
ncbi:hypothetical protein ACH4E8_02300 [Streptomyces sp. NPDC017979]|uniref:hypothetical protein n=1 Tax=Streptomyces sp. NPDC017979 TaxID=3365024 RepID=UPI0037BD5254